jgi:hypothetical protein
MAEVEKVLADLKANAARRAAADKEVRAARSELGRLLTRGKRAGIDVSTMARAAKTSRATAHTALRTIAAANGKKP